MYCGDETGAFIGDVGSHTARFGYGGEDCPKVVIPSAVYHSRSSTEDNAKRIVVGKRDIYGNLRPSALKKKYSAPVSLMRAPPDSCFFDEDVGDLGFVPIYSSLNSNHRRKGNNSTTYDGTIEDIDAWAALWEYSYRSLCVGGKGKHTMGYKYPQPEPESQPEVVEEPFGSRSLFPKRMIIQSPIDVPIDHPLLAVDSTSSNEMPTKEKENQRAAMLETLFESLSAPAAYIAPSAMLSSFAHGRQTSLVIDIGHSGSKVTPVVDGHCLNYGRVSSKRGGSWLGAVQKSVLEGVWEDSSTGSLSKWNGWGGFIEGPGSPPCRQKGISPRYLLHPTFSSNRCSENRLKVLKQSSFHSMTMHEVMFEMMTSSHMVSLERSKELLAPFYGYGNEEDGDNNVNMDVDLGAEDEDDDDDEPLYLLPDGTRVNLDKSKAGRDLCRLPELLFADTLSPYCSHYPNDSMLPLQKLVHKSLTQLLDADLRKELSSNIILTGGASLFPGLEKRLSVELGEVLPGSYKYKVTASKDSVEKRYSAWIGGSILSSLGSFQQLWLSKREYEECGAVLSLQRFKN